MLRAIIFDFDGIIVDSEPLIMRLTQRMAAREGWTVSDEDYYRNYLALDDRGIIEHLYETHGHRIDHARRDELVEWKTRLYAETIREGLPPILGAPEFVNKVADAAEQANHHPDIDIRYNTVTMALVSHDSGGVTARDVRMAETINKIAG